MESKGRDRILLNGDLTKNFIEISRKTEKNITSPKLLYFDLRAPLKMVI